MSNPSPNLRPSASGRWTQCTASPWFFIRMEAEGKVEDSSSVYANEGTTAHALAADKMGQLPKDEEYDKSFINAEMHAYVDGYVDLIRGFAGSFKNVYVEEKLKLFYEQPNAPEGTMDAGYIDEAERTIYVFDLKYGAGVSVQAEKNTQLGIYGRSFIEDMMPFYDFDKTWLVSLMVYQPRIKGEEPLRRWTQPYLDFLEWTDDIGKTAEKIMWEPDKLEFKPSEKACRFCPLQPFCSAYAEMLLGELPANPTKTDLPPVDHLEPEDIASVLRVKKQLIKWLNNAEAYAKDQASQGNRIPGFKLVKTLSNRKWKDDSIASVLMSNYFDDEDFITRSVISPTQAEKLFKTLEDEDAMKIFRDHVVRHPGQPALADLDDKREEWLPPTAESEFGELDDLI